MKISNSNLTAGLLAGNFKDTIQNCIASDNAYKFMSTIKGTPAYWQSMLSEVLAMVKQLGVPTWFLTLSCADLRWEEFITIIRRLNGELDTDHEDLDYQTRCNILNSNPVLLARQFQYRVETFMKEVVMDGQLGKIIYYVLRVEFTFRGSPHDHILLWAKNVPKLEDGKEKYIEHIDSVISANVPNRDENPKLWSLVTKYQIHSHSRTCSKYRKNECRFQFGKFFCKRTILSEPLPEDMDENEKHEILVSRSNVLQTVQEFIDSNLHPKKRNILDPEKPDFVDIGSIDTILESLGLTYKQYEYYLSISPDKDQHLFLKRDAFSCFVNNYFSEGLLAWEANIDIQPVFNAYKAVTYMCAYFSKSEDKCSKAMQEALKEAKDSNDSQYEKMSKIAKVYNSNRESSIQEAIYLTMPELWLRKCFPAVTFINTNLPDERYRIFKSKEEIEELPEDSEDLFKRNMLNRYVDRPNTTFKGGKYSQFDSMCYATFSANYTLDTRKTGNEENDWQPVVLDDNVNELNHADQSLPKSTPLMNSKEKLKSRKVPKVLRYYTPNKNKHPEKFAHHMLMLFYPFRSEEADLKIDGSYVLKLNMDEVKDIVNRNKQFFEPDGDLVNLVLQNYRDDMVHNQDSFAQQENEEVMDLMNIDQGSSEDDNNDNDTEEQSFAPFVQARHEFQSDDEINAHIRTLNSKQKEIFDVVLNWGKRHVQNLKSKNPILLDPIHIFLTGGAGVGKSHLVKCIYNCLSKLLAYKSEELEKPRIIKLAPTGIAAINISATTIHTGLSIQVKKFRIMGDNQRTLIRNRLKHVKLIIIDEISMVSSQLLLNIHTRICEIFGTNDNIPFAGKSIIVCGDLFQLAPIYPYPVFSTEGPIIGAFKLWHLFKLAELEEIMRQRDDSAFIDLLNNVRVGDINSLDENMIKSRIITRDNPDYPFESLHLFAENVCVNHHNMERLNTLPSEIIQEQAIDIPPNSLSQKQKDKIKYMDSKDTGGLSYEFSFKKQARVMLISNIDIEDRLINGQLGTIIEVRRRNNRVEKIYVKFDDEKAGLKAQSKDQYARTSQTVPIERAEANFPYDKKNPLSSPVVV